MAKDKTQATSGVDKTGAAKAGDKPAVKAPAKSRDEASGSSTSLGSRIAAAKEFFEQSKVELKKVTWPSRQDTMRTGIAVLIFSVVMAIYLGVVDMALSRLVALILS